MKNLDTENYNVSNIQLGDDEEEYVFLVNIEDIILNKNLLKKLNDNGSLFFDNKLKIFRFHQYKRAPISFKLKNFEYNRDILPKTIADFEATLLDENKSANLRRPSGKNSYSIQQNRYLY